MIENFTTPEKSNSEIENLDKLNKREDGVRKRHDELVKIHDDLSIKSISILFKSSAIGIDCEYVENNEGKGKQKKKIDGLDDLSMKCWMLRNDYNFKIYYRFFYKKISEDEINNILNDCDKILDDFSNVLCSQKKLLDKFGQELFEKEKNISCEKTKNIIEKMDKLFERSYILHNNHRNLFSKAIASYDKNINEMGMKFSDRCTNFDVKKNILCQELSDNFKFLYSQSISDDERKITIDLFERKLDHWQKKSDQLEKVIIDFSIKLNKAIKDYENDSDRVTGR